jgi:fused signal recognition particle receptor
MNDLLAYASLVIVAQCVVMVLLGFALPRWRDARRSAPGRETPRTFAGKFKAVLALLKRKQRTPEQVREDAEALPAAPAEKSEAAAETPAGEPEAPAAVSEAAEEPEAAAEAAETAAVEKKPESVMEPESAPVLLERVKTGLAKTRSLFVKRLDDLLGGSRKVDEELWEELEEILISADVGMKTTMDLRKVLEERCRKEGIGQGDALRAALMEEMENCLRRGEKPLDFNGVSPFVLMVVGVNGVGKTTTIGKLAHRLTREGKKVVLGACDTFRAAAAEQLTVWAQRAGADIVSHTPGADPAGVAFDAVRAAVARGASVVILDTAGRLHTKSNLMEEVRKIRRVVSREVPGAPHETLLVLDATLGQNSLVQARQFHEAVEVSGVALTKLDGTSRGGMIVAVGSELGIPVRYIGTGEDVDDLRPFDPHLFVTALFDKT